jgi:hypothetical protein
MKTLILSYKSRLYVKSQGVACHVSATTHLMEFIKDSNLYPGPGGEENYERVFYSHPQENNVNTLIDTVSEGVRVVREIYLYNTSGDAQVFSIRIRTYVDLTLLAGEGVGQKDHPDNYTDTCLIDIAIPSEKVWRFSEAFLLSYPSVIVLDNQNMDEISIVTAPTGVQTLNSSDKVHVTMSHGITGQTTWGITETITQKVISGTANTSLYKLPTSAAPIATVIKQICIYNASGKTIHVKVGFGPATSSNLAGYIYNGEIAPNGSWWSDGSTYQNIEDYTGGSGGSLTLNPVLPLSYTPSGSVIKIGQAGAQDRQVLGWDQTAGEWRPQDNLEVLTPVYPLEYNMSTLELLIGRKGASDGQTLTWSTANNRWQPGASSGSGALAGLEIDGGSY